MEGEKNHIQPLCTSGCGFFANPATDGLCSQCYKAFMKIPNPSPNPSTLTPVTMSTGGMTSAKIVSAQEVPAAAKPTVPQCRTIQDELEEKTTEATGSESPSCSVDLDDGNMAVTKKVEKFKKNRCVTCRKKVGLTGFECRCGGLYCAMHRYSDKHACRFDYKELGAQEIRRNNPVVVREKVQKI